MALSHRQSGQRRWHKENAGLATNDAALLRNVSSSAFGRPPGAPTNTSVGLCDIVLPLTTAINDVTAPDEAFFGSIAQSSADGIGASSYPPHTD